MDDDAGKILEAVLEADRARMVALQREFLRRLIALNFGEAVAIKYTPDVATRPQTIEEAEASAKELLDWFHGKARGQGDGR